MENNGKKMISVGQHEIPFLLIVSATLLLLM